MAKYSYSVNNWTPIAVADTTNFTNAGYMALQGGSSTQRILLWELYMGGLAGASSPAQMIFARDSIIGVTSLTGGNANVANDPSSAALAAPPAGFNSSTTKPQRSSTLQIWTPAFNAFGGVVRMKQNNADECPVLLGNTASFGELSLSHASTGTPGLMSSHFVYEPL